MIPEHPPCPSDPQAERQLRTLPDMLSYEFDEQGR
jgi:hypothetical protein